MADMKTHTRLASVMLQESVTLAGMEHTTIASMHVGIQTQILPAYIAPDGQPIPIDKGQRSDGLLFRRVHKGALAQTYTPWANVRGILYGE